MYGEDLPALVEAAGTQITLDLSTSVNMAALNYTGAPPAGQRACAQQRHAVADDTDDPRFLRIAATPITWLSRPSAM
jgi:hypothetical protein